MKLSEGSFSFSFTEERKTCPLLPDYNPPGAFPVSCFDDNFEGSICTYVCLPGYQLVGTSELECVEGTGRWNLDPPRCGKLNLRTFWWPIVSKQYFFAYTMATCDHHHHEKNLQK